MCLCKKVGLSFQASIPVALKITPLMNDNRLTKCVTRSKTNLSYNDPNTSLPCDLPRVDNDVRVFSKRDPSLILPTSITVEADTPKLRVVTVRRSTEQMRSLYGLEIKEWYKKRRKKLLDRRRCWLKKGGNASQTQLPLGIPSFPLQVCYAQLTNKQVTDEFHTFTIRSSSNDGSVYLFVVPGVFMRDFLLNFKMGQFYQHAKGLMRVIPGNSGTSYYQFHWMGSKKKFDDTRRYDWQDNLLLNNSTCYSLESLIHQIMDRLETTGELALEPGEISWEFYPSIVFTKGTASHQKPHLDFPMAHTMRAGRIPFILHLPLCEEGLALQLWKCWKGELLGSISPKFIFVPFGSALLLRADVYHAGCYGTKGNFRLHGMILPPDLPRETRSLQHLREGTNTSSHQLQDVNPVTLLAVLLSENHKKTTHHYISLLEKMISSPRFWVEKPLNNLQWT